jgi:ABC-type transporter Mla MlaB component
MKKRKQASSAKPRDSRGGRSTPAKGRSQNVARVTKSKGTRSARGGKEPVVAEAVQPAEAMRPAEAVEAAEPNPAAEPAQAAEATPAAEPAQAVEPTQAVEPAATALTLSAECMVSQAAALKEQLAALLEQPLPVTLDISSLQRIDTAGLQVITAFVRDRAAHGREVAWHGEAPVLATAAQLLGLTSLLRLPA